MSGEVPVAGGAPPLGSNSQAAPAAQTTAPISAQTQGAEIIEPIAPLAEDEVVPEVPVPGQGALPADQTLACQIVGSNAFNILVIPLTRVTDPTTAP